SHLHGRVHGRGARRADGRGTGDRAAGAQRGLNRRSGGYLGSAGPTTLACGTERCLTPRFSPQEACVPEILPDLRTADGVLFDLDGVLTPTAEVHMRAWQSVFDDVFQQWGITPAYTEVDYYAYVDGKQRSDGVASVLRSRNVEIPWGDVADD